VTDRIVLAAMRFQGHHGVTAEERAEPQPIEVDVEMALDLQPAGSEDELERTADYGRAYDICREVVESASFRLLEAIAEGIAHELLAAYPRVREVAVRVRKMRLRGRDLAYAGVEIKRRARGRPRRA
jgi:7,8-dihydroneopterin aldolase/epimerase/oxygenase